jgi:tRNA pseudouridine55 synthase
MATRKGRPVDGILLLDKAVGVSSNQALQEVKRLYHARKAGHTGSLDCLAGGLLPICFGEATKVSGYLLDADKRYWAKCQLGIETTTGDAEGEVAASAPIPALDRQRLEEMLAGFLGAQDQVPPMHSAIKQGGQPLYKLAHRGITVARAARRVTIHEIQLLDFNKETLELDIRCSKGTYIRTLVEDIGWALGSCAFLAGLRRLGAGHFRIEQAVTYAELQANPDLAELDKRLLATDKALAHKPDVALTEDAAHYMRRGQPVMVPHAPLDGIVRLYDSHRRFLGVGQVLDDGRIAPYRLLAEANVKNVA